MVENSETIESKNLAIKMNNLSIETESYKYKEIPDVQSSLFQNLLKPKSQSRPMFWAEWEGKSQCPGFLERYEFDFTQICYFP